MITKSLIMQNSQCGLATFLKTHHKKEAEYSSGTQRAFDIGHEVNEYAFKHLSKGTNQLIDTLETNRALEWTEEALGTCESVFEGAFIRDGVLVRIDLLRKNGDGWDIIEVKSSTKVKEEHIKDVSIQAFVASKFINIKQVYISVINKEGFQYPDNIFHLEEVSNDLDFDWVRENIKKTFQNTKYELSIKPSSHCSKPYDCPFLKFCKKRNGIPTPSSLEVNFPNRWDYVEKGIYDLKEVSEDHLYINTHKKGEPWINHEGLKKELEGLEEFHSLDFESIAYPVPKVSYLAPYENIPFQFSVDTQTKIGINHFDYLNTQKGEYLEALIEALLKISEDNLKVLVWNESFERGQIKKLSTLYPQYSKGLEKVNGKIIDLMKVVKRNYYHPKQMGSFSLKAVAPVLTDIAYDELEINNGTLAQSGYLKLLETGSKEIEKNLRDYCSQDTLIPVMIVASLKKLLK